MPPRPQPKTHQLLLKSHKFTVALSGVAPSTTISQLKREALSAMNSPAAEGLLPPHLLSNLESHNDFELCKMDRERGRPTGTYSVLDAGRQVREHGLAAWDVLYVQWRNMDTRALLPVTVTLPLIDEPEEEETTEGDGDDSVMMPPPPPAREPKVDKGKGKRRAELVDEDTLDDDLDI